MLRRLRRIVGLDRLARWRRRRAKRRELHAKLEELRAAYESDFQKAGDDELEYQRVVSSYMEEAREFDEAIDAMEWQELLAAAGKFDLEVPGIHRGNPQYRDLRHRISEARFVYWKRWAEITVPILSLLVALAAVLKGCAARP